MTKTDKNEEEKRGVTGSGPLPDLAKTRKTRVFPGDERSDGMTL